jgi:hypothetical protein
MTLGVAEVVPPAGVVAAPAGLVAVKLGPGKATKAAASHPEHKAQVAPMPKEILLCNYCRKPLFAQCMLSLVVTVTCCAVVMQV